MKLYLVLIFVCVFYSCTHKHIDEKVFKDNEITVKWYTVSAISSGHDFVDVERWGYEHNIIESNTNGILDIKIIKDTIIIKTKPGLLIYDLAAIKHGCIIKIDSTSVMQ